MHGAETTALHSLFASKTVDDFVAVKAPDFNRFQQPARNSFNSNHLRSAESYKFQ